jgi:hypothetical protein
MGLGTNGLANGLRREGVLIPVDESCLWLVFGPRKRARGRLGDRPCSSVCERMVECGERGCVSLVRMFAIVVIDEECGRPKRPGLVGITGCRYVEMSECLER